MSVCQCCVIIEKQRDHAKTMYYRRLMRGLAEKWTRNFAVNNVLTACYLTNVQVINRTHHVSLAVILIMRTV
jgi:hypothetical protein